MDVEQFLASDIETGKILTAVQQLNLQDWWVCAGYIRKKVWDYLSRDQKDTMLADIDVIYFDAADTNETTEKAYEAALHRLLPGLPWSVKNQARMHVVSGLSPYKSSQDAIAKFPETVTSLGITLDEKDEVVLYAPHGLEDLLQFNIRPTPHFMKEASRMKIFYKRLDEKGWVFTWPEVTEDDTTRRTHHEQS